MEEEGDEPITTMARKGEGEPIHVMQGRRGWISLWWCLREKHELPRLPLGILGKGGHLGLQPSITLGEDNSIAMDKKEKVTSTASSKKELLWLRNWRNFVRTIESLLP